MSANQASSWLIVHSTEVWLVYCCLHPGSPLHQSFTRYMKGLCCNLHGPGAPDRGLTERWPLLLTGIAPWSTTFHPPSLHRLPPQRPPQPALLPQTQQRMPLLGPPASTFARTTRNGKAAGGPEPTALHSYDGDRLRWQLAWSPAQQARVSAADASAVITPCGSNVFFVRLLGVVSLRLDGAATWHLHRYLIDGQLHSMPAL